MEGAQEHVFQCSEPAGGVEDHLGLGSVACVDGLDRAPEHVSGRHQMADARAVSGEQLQHLNAVG